MRIAPIGLLVALALAASGCGAAKQGAATGGAGLVPATAPAFVAIDSDLGSDQWRKADALLKKFPIRSQAVKTLDSVMSQSGLDYEKDVKPALGPEVDLVWLDLANNGSNVVALTKPKDEAKFKALIAKANPSGSKVATGKVGGWTVLANSQAQIDRFQSASGDAKKLRDDSTFRDAMARLPSDAVVKAYAKGTSLVDALTQVVPATTMPRGAFDMPSAQRPDYVAAALAAQSDGLRFAVAYRLQQDPKIAPYKSTFVGQVPGDALVFLTFRGGDQLAQVQSNPAYQQGLRQFEQMLGVKVAPLIGLLKGEVAFYVRPQAPIPELTLVAEAADEQSALTLVDGLMFRLTPKIATAQQDGITVKSANFGKFVVHYAVFDGKLIITNGDQGIQAFRSNDSKLPDAKAYKAARKAAEAPDESAGFAYVDLKDGIPLIERYAGVAGTSVPPQVNQNLAPLQSFLAWATVDGRTSVANVFLQIG